MSTLNDKYDVFISFRGVDTRRKFMCFLRDALMNEGIRTFTDHRLEKGREVGPKLAQAIQNSHISIVIFSKCYANSKWCLDELLKIIERKKHHGQVLIPVFYKVEPTHVRNQTGPYEKALARFKTDESKLSEWRNALTEAANICGWDSSIHWEVSKFIQAIVNDVKGKLSLIRPNEEEEPFEINEKRGCIEDLLEKHSRIGIWGMGGMGKTTIAKSVFTNQIAHYQSGCFLKNVREQTRDFGSEFVRNTLLSELLKRPITKSDSLTSSTMKKVLVVLDDVEDDNQLHDLCGELKSLGPDCRLIITTRDRRILETRVDHVYEVSPWNIPESLRFFNLKAFGKNDSEMGYESLSKRAVACSGLVPLALKVLGKHLRDREPDFWKEQLDALENKEFDSLDTTVRQVLQRSYDTLRMNEKEIFLDIAFFFKDQDKDFVIRILKACGFSPVRGIKILEEKALITISKCNKIQMHDLLQIMGMEIVQEECIKRPGKRSRLNKIDQIRDVFKNNEGSDAVEGITADLSEEVDLQLNADTFNKMSKLRFLRLHVPYGKQKVANIHHPGVLDRWSYELRYLEWNGFPMMSFPSKFSAELLVEIRMPHSHVEQLWEGVQNLKNLEAIDLRECKQLNRLPDLSKASELKWVYVSGCESLCEVKLSHLSANELITLKMDRCIKVEFEGKKHFKRLQECIVDECSSLKEFPLSSDSITRLDLSMTGVKILHSTIGRLSKLVYLNLRGLHLQNLPQQLSLLTSLKELNISYTGQLVTKHNLQLVFNGLQSLEVLHLMHCYDLFQLPDNISTLSSLHELILDGSSIQTLPSTIKHLQNLEFLSLNNCRQLHVLPDLPPSVKDLSMVNCTFLSSFTESTLKNFSIPMEGKNKYISFKNGTNLNQSSLMRIMKDAQFIMNSAALHNVLVRMFGTETHSYNYNSVEVCLPASNVTTSFTRQAEGSSITVEIPGRVSNLVGLIYSAVLSPPQGMEQYGVTIQCQCRREDHRPVGHATAWDRETIMELNSDHVFLWYDPYHYDSIIEDDKQTLRFEFSVAAENGELDQPVRIKECGVHLIRGSELEFHNFLLELELELKLKLDLGLRLGLALDLQQGRGNFHHNARLFFALEMGRELELEESLKLKLESRRRALLTLLGREDEGGRRLGFWDYMLGFLRYLWRLIGT